LAVAWAVFSVQSPPLAEIDTAARQTAAVSNNSPISGGPFIESFTGQNIKRQNLNQAAPRENLTEFFIKNVGEDITKQGPGGPANIDGVSYSSYLSAPDPELTVEELIAEAAEKFDPETLRPTVNDTDLTIYGDNSKESLASYFNDFQKIISDASEEIPLEFVTGEITMEGMALVAEIYGKSIDKFYELPVPSSALSFHKRQIELLGVKKNIFETIINYQKDPITTVLAIQELEKNNREFEELAAQMSKFISEL